MLSILFCFTFLLTVGVSTFSPIEGSWLYYAGSEIPLFEAVALYFTCDSPSDCTLLLDWGPGQYEFSVLLTPGYPIRSFIFTNFRKLTLL